MIKSLLEDYVDRRDRGFCQVESLIRDIQSLKEACNKPDSNLSSLQQHIKRLEDENEDLKTNLFSLRDRCLKDLQKGGWVPKEDQLIRQEFATLQEDISIWSKSHGFTSLSELENKSSKAGKLELIGHLHAEGCCSEGNWDLLIEKSAFQDKIPILVLQAFVAHNIFTKIFHPFFTLLCRSDLNFNRYTAPPAELHRVYEEMKAGETG
jgi:regulator of replication initiation timing